MQYEKTQYEDSIIGEEFLVSYETISFLKRTLLHRDGSR
jgi:hypothetical protein